MKLLLNYHLPMYFQKMYEVLQLLHHQSDIHFGIHYPRRS
jgi:hypothetical protein